MIDLTAFVVSANAINRRYVSGAGWQVITHQTKLYPSTLGRHLIGRTALAKLYLVQGLTIMDIKADKFRALRIVGRRTDLVEDLGSAVL